MYVLTQHDLAGEALGQTGTAQFSPGCCSSQGGVFKGPSSQSPSVREFGLDVLELSVDHFELLNLVIYGGPGEPAIRM